MTEFNRMTIVAAAQVISDFNSHSYMEVLAVQWGIAGRCSSSSKDARIADLANIAIEGRDRGPDRKRACKPGQGFDRNCH